MSDTEHHNGAAANIQDVSTADAPPAVVEAPAEGETTVTQESTDAAAGTGNVAHERRGSAVAHHEHDHDRHRNLTGVQGGKEIVDDRLQASGSVHSATHGAHHHHRPVAAGSVEVHDDDAAPLPRTRLFDLDSVRGASAENVNTNASNSGVFANDTAGRSASGSVGGGANAPPTVLPNNMRSVRLGGQIPAFAAVESSKYPKVMLGVEFWNEVTSALKRSMGDSPRPGGASPMRSGATTPRSRSATPNLTGAHSPSAHSPRGYGSRRSGSPVAGHTLNAANVARHNATLGTGTADDLHSAALFEAHSIELAGDKVGVPAAGLTAALCAIGGDCPERVAAAVLFQLAPPGFSNTLPEPQFMKALQVTRAVLTRHSMARQLRTRTPERHRTDGSLVPAEGKPLQEILGVVPLGEVADARAGPRSNRSLSMSSGVAGRATSPRGATAGDSKTAKSTPRSSYPTRAYQPHAGTQSHVTGTTTMRRSLSPAMAIGGQGVHTQTLQSVRAAAIGAAKRSAVEATEAEEAVRRDGALAASHGRPERMSPARIQQRAASPGPGPGPGSPRGQQPGPGSPRAPSPRVTGARPVSSNTPFHSTAQRLSSPIRTASSNIPGRRAVPPPTPPRTSSPAAVGRQSPRPMSRGPTPTRTAPAPVPSPVTARPRSTLRTGPQPQLRAAGSSPTAAQRNASPIGSPRTLSPTVPPRRSVPTAISSPLPTTGAWRPGGGVGAVRRGGTPTRASYPSPAAVRSPRPTQRPGTPPNERQQDDSAMLHTPRSQTDAPVGAGPASPSSASFLTPPRGTDRSTAKGSPSSPRPYNSGPQPPAAITATTRVVRSSGYQPIGAVSRTSLGTNVRPPRVAYLAPSPTKSPRPNTGSPAASPAKSSPVRSVPVSIPTSYGSSPSSMRRRPMTPEEMAQVLSPEAKARRHASSLPTRNSLVQREPKLVHCRDGELAMRHISMRRAATRHSGRVSVAAMGTTAPLQSRASRPTSSHASPALVSSMAAPRRSFSTTPVAHSSSSGGSGEETSGDTAEGHSSVHTKTVGDSKTRLVVVLFTSTDIRVKDNYALALAAAKAKKEQCPLACLYCYDERTFAQPSLVAGFYRTGPQRVAALNECVASLRHQLRSYGGELYVRVGRPEDVVPVFTRALLTAEAIGAGDAASLPAAKALSSSSSFAAPPQVEGEDLELDDDDATAGVTAAADVARYEAELCALSQVGTSTDLLRAVAAEKTAAGEISPALARALQRSVSESVLDLDGVSVFASTQYAPHEAWVQHQMKAALTSGTMSALRAESDAGTAPIDRDDGESTTVRDGTLYSSLTLDGKGQARLQYTRSDGSFAGGVSSSDSSGQTGGTAGSAGGAVLNTVWQSTLIHIDDLSTPPAAMSHMLRPFWDEYQLLTPRPVPPYDCTDGRLRRGIRWASMDPAAVRDRMSTATGPAGEPVPMRTVSDTTAASSASTQTKSGSEKSADGVADQIVHAVPPTPMYEYVPEPESDPTALAAVTYKTRPKRRQEANTAGDRCCGALPTLASLGYDARQGFLGRDGARFKNYKYCHGGEAGAIEHLQQWMETGGLRDYVALGRDKSTRVQQHGVNASIISGAIAHGAMSPRVYYEMLREYSYDMMGKGTTENAVLEGFYRMAQRDFWHFSGLRWGHTLFAEYGPRPEDTDDIPEYRIDPHIIHKWCHGQTGVPFADAAMLELTNSGWCNHPGRQALTWQLTRGYGQDWRVAAEWFERTCIDYDPFVCYGNTAYFSELIKDRFGEPVRSLSYISAKQDSTGIYTKRWLPLLERVPEAFIHRPHVMTLEMQQMHQVVLGESYPYPIKLWAGATKELPAGALKAMRAGDMAAIKKLEPGWGEAGKCSTAVLPKTEAMPAVPAAFVEKQQLIVGKAEAIANRYALAEHARRRAPPQPTLAQQEKVQQIAH